jgi:hypothetical protein
MNEEQCRRAKQYAQWIQPEARESSPQSIRKDGDGAKRRNPDAELEKMMERRIEERGY